MLERQKSTPQTRSIVQLVASSLESGGRGYLAWMLEKKKRTASHLVFKIKALGISGCRSRVFGFKV